MSSTGPNNAFNIPLPDAQRDRRQSPRIHVKWKATIQTSGIPVPVQVIEISDVGFGFVGDIAYPIGSELSFQVNVPDPANGGQWRLVGGRGEVINSVLTREGFRSGITMKSVSAADQELLKSWIKSRLRE